MSGNGDETREMRQERVEFLAQLVLQVLRDVSEVQTWRDIATVAVHYYKKHKRRFLDGDVSGILTRTKKKDYWVRRSYITNAKSKAEIRDALAKEGHYIATVIGEGIYLADTEKQIAADHAMVAKMTISRADRQSYRAVELNKSKGYRLGMIISKLEQLPENVS